MKLATIFLVPFYFKEDNGTIQDMPCMAACNLPQCEKGEQLVPSGKYRIAGQKDTGRAKLCKDSFADLCFPATVHF